MENFNITINGVNYLFVCEFKNTRNGFCHNCNVFDDHNYLGKARISYLNRTWESFTFQSVLNHACKKFKIDHKF